MLKIIFPLKSTVKETSDQSPQITSMGILLYGNKGNGLSRGPKPTVGISAAESVVETDGLTSAVAVLEGPLVVGERWPLSHGSLPGTGL